MCARVICRLPQGVVTGLLLFVVGSTNGYADWPAFRGPGRDGTVEGSSLPLKWSNSEGVHWKCDLPGQGWSSPIVVGQRIYLTAAVPTADDGFDLVLLLVDTSSGELIKHQRIFTQSNSAPKIHKKNSHASPTPVFDGQAIYVHFGHQGTASVDLDGNILWKNQELGYAPVHGNGGSPTVVGQNLIFSRDGANISEVTALDKTSGKIRWRLERDVEANKRFSFCTPLVLNEPGIRPQLILPGSNVVQGLDPKTGKEIWRLRYDGYSVIPRPIFESGLVFVCTGYNRPSLLAIDPKGQGDVTDTHLRWSLKTNVPHTPSLIAFRGTVAMVSDRGIASCVDAHTGDEIWKRRIGGNFSASPVLVGERLYVMNEDGVCTVLSVVDGSELARNKMGERTLASLSVVENDYLVRTDTALYRISDE